MASMLVRTKVSPANLAIKVMKSVVGLVFVAPPPHAAIKPVSKMIMVIGSAYLLILFIYNFLFSFFRLRGMGFRSSLTSQTIPNQLSVLRVRLAAL
jgi:hypothetical protein